jgi:S-formylglutathione hydrolase FrmB
MLTVGDQDNVYGPQQHAVQKALERAGVPVEFATVPGGHTWTVFGAALERSLPWLGARLGLS